MVTSIALLSIIVPSRHTGIGAWDNSEMYIGILYNIINCHARPPRPSEHPPVVGGKKQTQNTREAWDTTQFLEFVTLHLSIDVDVILDTCSTTIEIIICYHK